MMWRIGDGRTVSFGHDEWVLRLGILHDYLFYGKYIPPNVKVRDFVDSNGCWKMTELSDLFSKNILEYIVACHPSRDEFGADLCC